MLASRTWAKKYLYDIYNNNNELTKRKKKVSDTKVYVSSKENKNERKKSYVYIGIELKEKLNEKIFLIFVKHFDHVILRIRIFGEEGMYLPFSPLYDYRDTHTPPNNILFGFKKPYKNSYNINIPSTSEESEEKWWKENIWYFFSNSYICPPHSQI